MRPKLCLLICGLLLMAAFARAELITGNFIQNPSFESGNTNFTSDYTFKATYRPPDLDAGQYQIVTNAFTQAHSAWADFGAQDGTNYFVANASADTNNSPWMQTFTINPGDIVTSTSNAPVYYRFEAYISSLFPANPPELAFEMSLNNSGAWQQLTTSLAPGTPGEWNLTYRDGYFGFAPTTISFRLRNTVAEGFGNDLGIDSIYFGFSTNSPSYTLDPIANPIDSIGAITGGVVPEPGTWAAALLLLGTAGCVRWRRRA